MAAAITKIISYLLIVVLGYALKRAKLFKAENSDLISKIILNITLPCVIITSFQSVIMSGQFVISLRQGQVRKDAVRHLCTLAEYWIFRNPYRSSLLFPRGHSFTLCF